MKIADLFVKIGIEGAAAVQKGLKGINKGLGSVVGGLNKYALAAGAAIFSFKKIVDVSGEAARELRNFNLLTGRSTTTIQKWQFVGKQFGITAEEMANSVTSVQEVFSKMDRGKGVPEGFAPIWTVLEKMGGFDTRKAARDPFYGLQRLQAFARANELGPELEGEFLRSFGLSNKMIAAMQKGAFNANAFKKAITLDKSEIDSLVQLNKEWVILGAHVEKVATKIHSMIGPWLIDRLKDITYSINLAVDGLKALPEAIADIIVKLEMLDLKGFFGLGKPSLKEMQKSGASGNWGGTINNYFNVPVDERTVNKINRDFKKSTNDVLTNLSTRNRGN